MTTRSHSGRMFMNLIDFILLLALTALACSVPCGGTRVPAGPSNTPYVAIPPIDTQLPAVVDTPSAPLSANTPSAPSAAVCLWENSFSDANGWNKEPYWNSIQFADVNGDGRADVCARGIAGEYCGVSSGTAFSAATVWEDNFSDGNGWNKSPYWNTISFPDVNGDAKADICGRGLAGEYCGISNGYVFSAVTLWETNFSDANGWNKSPYS